METTQWRGKRSTRATVATARPRVLSAKFCGTTSTLLLKVRLLGSFPRTTASSASTVRCWWTLSTVETSWFALTDFFVRTLRLLTSSPVTYCVCRWSVGLAAPPRTSTVSRLCRSTERWARLPRLLRRPLSPLRPPLHLPRWLLRLPRMTRSCRSEGRDHWGHVELQVFRSSPD